MQTFQFVSILIITSVLISCNSTKRNQSEITSKLPELSQSDSTQIMKTFMATKDAWNEANLESFMEGYWDSDSLAYVGSSGPFYGYDAILKRYQNTYPDKDAMGKLDFEVLNLYQVDQKTAIMIGRFYLTRTIGYLQGYYTLVWHKFDDKWLIIADHSSAEQPSDPKKQSDD